MIVNPTRANWGPASLVDSRRAALATDASWASAKMAAGWASRVTSGVINTAEMASYFCFQ